VGTVAAPDFKWQNQQIIVCMCGHCASWLSPAQLPQSLARCNTKYLTSDFGRQAACICADNKYVCVSLEDGIGQGAVIEVCFSLRISNDRDYPIQKKHT